MLIQIITNHDNGAGLEKDASILSGHARAAGHTVHLAHIHRPWEVGRADVNVFLEVVVPSYVSYARHNWLVPNSEWYCAARWDRALPRMDLILCKTADSVDIWQKRGQVPVRFIGWEAIDRYQPNIPKESTFLHLAGKSLTKNTSAVIDAWKTENMPFPLTVVTFKPEIARLCRNVANVRLVDRFSESEVTDAMNRNRFLIMPSRYEGYGHAIHEALACRSVVITTDAPPMSHIHGVEPAMRAKPYFQTTMGLANVHHVSPEDLAAVVRRAAATPLPELEAIGDNARAAYLQDRAAFRVAIADVLAVGVPA